MFRYSTALFIAGFCIAGAAQAQVMNMNRIDVSQRVPVRTERDSSLVEGAQVAGDSSRIETRTQVQGTDEVARADVQRTDEVARTDVQRQDVGERADRSGPVPFADLGRVGGDGKTLDTDKAIEQDKQLLARGEIRDDELVIHLPAGTLKDTLSLRSDNGLNLSRADVKRLGRFDGDDLRLCLTELNRSASNLGNLWIWGTGPDSASLLQRVAMNGPSAPAVAQTDVQTQDVPQRRSAGVGSTLGAPINEPNMMTREQVDRDNQIDREKQMEIDAGLQKSATDEHTHW